MDNADQILTFAKGDKALAGILRSCLTRLADGTGGKNLQWMAREALTGKFDLRQLARLSMLQADAQDKLAGLVAWREQVGQAEFERQGNLAGEVVAALTNPPAEPAESGPTRRPGVRPPNDPNDTWVDLYPNPHARES
jgi:hypothetical protein